METETTAITLSSQRVWMDVYLGRIWCVMARYRFMHRFNNTVLGQNRFDGKSNEKQILLCE